MTTFRSAFLLIGLVFSFGVQDSRQNQLMDAQQAFQQARYHGRPIGQFLADEYINISQVGILDGKREAISREPSRDIALDRLESRNVRVFGAVGLVTGRTGMEGAPGPVRRMFVWALRQNRWEMVAAHTTFIEPNAWVVRYARPADGRLVLPSSVAEQTVVDANNALDAPIRDRKVLIADDSELVDEHGRFLSRDDWIAARDKAAAGGRILSITQIVGLGDAVLLVGQEAPSVTPERATRFMRLWVRRDSAWQMVISQASPIEVR
jgi:hypothetical protein